MYDRGRILTLGHALLVVAVLASCSASPAPTTPSAVPSLPTERPAAGAAWGPLAVLPPQDGTDLARAEGTLRITDTCVFLARAGERMLLMWPADRTLWNAETRTIAFRNFDGTTVTVGDGTRVILGGGGDSNREAGTTTEAWLTRMRWVAPPHASCPLEARFGVGILTR